MRVPAATVEELAHSWEFQVGLYDTVGPAGITYDPIMVQGEPAIGIWLSRSESGELNGVFYYYCRDILEDGEIVRAGTIVVCVDPECQRQGIGTALLMAAHAPVVLAETQEYTPAGRALALRYLRERG